MQKDHRNYQTTGLNNFFNFLFKSFISPYKSIKEKQNLF